MKGANLRCRLRKWSEEKPSAQVRLGQGLRTQLCRNVARGLEVEHGSVADDVTTVKCGIHETPSNPSKLDCLIRTFWRRRSSVFIGVKYL